MTSTRSRPEPAHNQKSTSRKFFETFAAGALKAMGLVTGHTLASELMDFIRS